MDKVVGKTSKAKNSKIENERKRLKKSVQQINFVDHGKNGVSVKKSISDITKSSLKRRKDARLLGRICSYYELKEVTELGTSLGITTSYLASNADQVTTLEGSSEVAAVAESVWGYLGLENIKLIEGNFDATIDQLTGKEYDLFFIDGNHQKEPTLRYFEQLLKYSHAKTFFVFDDINWSEGMQEAWKVIQNHPRTIVSMDLFHLGIVLINPELSKENFVLKF